MLRWLLGVLAHVWSTVLPRFLHRALTCSADILQPMLCLRLSAMSCIALLQCVSTLLSSTSGSTSPHSVSSTAATPKDPATEHHRRKARSGPQLLLLLMACGR